MHNAARSRVGSEPTLKAPNQHPHRPLVSFHALWEHFQPTPNWTWVHLLQRCPDFAWGKPAQIFMPLETLQKHKLFQLKFAVAKGQGEHGEAHTCSAHSSVCRCRSASSSAWAAARLSPSARFSPSSAAMASACSKQSRVRLYTCQLTYAMPCP